MTKRHGHKERVTVTLDPALVRAGTDAVERGLASSLSGWINLAIAERAEKDARLRGLNAAIAAYEAEFGVITPEEVAAQRRKDKRNAIVVRGRGRRRSA